MNQFRNVVLGLGAYYIGAWAVLPLSLLLSPLTNGASFQDGIQSLLLMPLVFSLPSTISACGVGAIVARTVESPHPVRWALVPAALFLVLRLVSGEWLTEPTLGDRLSQVAEGLYPAVACVLVAVWAQRRNQDRAKLPNPPLQPASSADKQ